MHGMQYASTTSIGATDAARTRWARPETLWVASWLLLCLPWLIGTKVIPYDAVQQFFPAVSFSAEQLRNLQAPWWNPYLFGGYPQIADPQMMTLQPTMVLPMLLAPASLHLFTAVVLLHVLAGGFGALRLARSFGLSAPAQWFFAMVLMFGAVAASRLQHTPMIVSYSLLPWIWLGLSNVRNQGRARDVLLAGLAGGLCALQLTQVTYFIILACAVYAVGAVLWATGKRLRLALQLSAVALIAAAVSAPQWLSTLAWLGDTNRDGMNLETALAGAMHWQGLVTVLSGNVFSQVRGTSWSFGDISTDYLYFGAVPLALWLAWGGSVVHRQRRATCLALTVLLLTTLVALGDVTPLFAWLFSGLPGLDLFRRPSDALFLAVPAAAWLGAQALQVALEKRDLRPHRVSFGVVVVLVSVASWLAVSHGHLDAFAWLAASAGIGIAAVQLLRRHPAPMRWLIALVVFDMLLFNVGARFNTSGARPPVMTAERNGATQRAYALLAAERSAGLPERAIVFGIGVLTNGAAVHAIPLANGYNPLLSSDYQQMVGMPTEPVAAFQQKATTPWAPDMDAPVYDLLGVRWLLSPEPFAGSDDQGSDVQLALRGSVLPRTLNPQRVQRHLERLPPAAEFNQTDFSQVVWLPSGQQTDCPDREAGQLKVLSQAYQPGWIALDVNAEHPAWLVINEVTAQGWQARLDGGASLPLMRANGLFHAVCVPAGRHRVELGYSPLQLWRDGLRKRFAKGGAG